MPSDTQLKNANPKGTPKGGKKSPMGIPIWGWVIAAALGIIIGYTILKKSGGGSATSQDAQSPDQSTGASGDPGASGSVALPPDVLSALGLSPTGGGASQTSAGSTTTDSSATQEANQAAVNPSISSPVMNGAQTEGSTMGSAAAIMPGSSPVWDAIANVTPSAIALAPQFRNPAPAPITPEMSHAEFIAKQQPVHTAGL